MGSVRITRAGIDGNRDDAIFWVVNQEEGTCRAAAESSTKLGPVAEG